MARYQFYTAPVNRENSTPINRVICVSTYGGKPVRGVAVCSEHDEFDEEVGKMIAQSRCDYKIAVKRLKRANQKRAEAQKMVEEAQEYLRKMEEYVNDAAEEYNRCHKTATTVYLEYKDM